MEVIKRIGFSFTPLTSEILEEHVAGFFKTLPLISETKNRRLVAAIYYFYTSSRLLVSGHSQWEFMAECILNLNKTLEILFGGTRDLIRDGLSKLGYETEEIEGDYMVLNLIAASEDNFCFQRVSV